MRKLYSLAIGMLAALAATILALGSPALAQATAKSGHATGTLYLERSAATPGDNFLAGFHLEMAEGWHVYWRNAGDSGLPPSVTWSSAPQVSAGEFRFPAPHAIPLGPLMNYGYEGKVLFPFEIKVSPDAKAGDELTVDGVFDYLICADICIPESVTLLVTLPIAAAPQANADSSAIIAETLKDIPGPLTGRASIERTGDGFRLGIVDPAIAAAAASAADMRYFPNGPEILHPPVQPAKIGPEGVVLELKASAFARPDSTVPGVLVISKADGTHSAWEVTPLGGPIPAGLDSKELVRSAVAAQPPPAPASAPLDLAALAVTLGFAFLGGLVLNLMPCVLPVLTIKAAGLVHTAHDPAQSRAHGLAYLAGVLVCFALIAATLIALKAAGDTSAGLGFQLQYSWVTAFFALVMFAIGLNLLGVFEIGGSLMGVGSGLAQKGGASGAFFTGLLAAFVGAPCVGPFMAGAVGAALTQPPPVIFAVFLTIGLGMAAPFVLLSFTPAFAKVLPKPGKWMETFRQVLAFPMFLTALWLLWVLAGQAGADGVIAVVGGGVALAFGIWLATKIGSGLVGRIISGAVILAAFIVPSIASTSFKASAAVVTTATWSPQRVSELRAEGKVIFVDFTARWCVTCQVNKGAMHDPAVAKTFADLGVVFLEADWTNKDKVIAEELARHGAAGVPLYLVYPASGAEPRKFDGLLTTDMIQQAVREAAGTI